jgi:hypothetical protein
LCILSHAQNAKQPPISPSAASAYQNSEVILQKYYAGSMTLATALSLSLAFVTVCGAFQADPPLACNLKAISAADRPRYADLMKRLRAAVADQSELPDGYSYALDTKRATLPEIAEWITMERLCCPFLMFQLDVKGSGESRLILRGPDGVKAILREEFPENR